MIYDNLSPTQARIAPLIQRGMTGKEIAAELGITKRSVDTQTSILLQKMGAKNRYELGAMLRAQP